MYNKLFGKILNSSIWLAPDGERLVWITLLAAMDQDCIAHFASVGNLAHAARVEPEVARAAVASFEGPDPESGDPENEGRRIERVPGGWYILNGPKYKAIATAEHARAQGRERIKAWRERNARVTLAYDSVRNDNVLVTPSETETETEAGSKNTRAVAKATRPPLPPEWTECRATYPKRDGNQPWTRAEHAVRARLAEGELWTTIVEGTARYAAYCRGKGIVGTPYVMQAATFYGKDRAYQQPWEASQAAGKWERETAEQLEAAERSARTGTDE